MMHCKCEFMVSNACVLTLIVHIMQFYRQVKMLEFHQLFSYGEACASNMFETEGHSQTTFLRWTLSLHAHSLRLTLKPIYSGPSYFLTVPNCQVYLTYLG